MPHAGSERSLEKLRQLQLIAKPAMEAMEVDPVEGDAGGGGELLRLGIHGAMEMGGNTPCSGYSGYPYNNRRLDDEDGWQRYEEGPPRGGAGSAYHPSMVWLVVLTFVYFTSGVPAGSWDAVLHQSTRHDARN